VAHPTSHGRGTYVSENLEQDAAAFVCSHSPHAVGMYVRTSHIINSGTACPRTLGWPAQLALA
jgi:hypothetical protein